MCLHNSETTEKSGDLSPHKQHNSLTVFSSPLARDSGAGEQCMNMQGVICVCFWNMFIQGAQRVHDESLFAAAVNVNLLWF